MEKVLPQLQQCLRIKMVSNSAKRKNQPRLTVSGRTHTPAGETTTDIRQDILFCRQGPARLLPAAWPIAPCGKVAIITIHCNNRMPLVEYIHGVRIASSATSILQGVQLARITHWPAPGNIHTHDDIADSIQHTPPWQTMVVFPS